MAASDPGSRKNKWGAFLFSVYSSQVGAVWHDLVFARLMAAWRGKKNVNSGAVPNPMTSEKLETQGSRMQNNPPSHRLPALLQTQAFNRWAKPVGANRMGWVGWSVLSELVYLLSVLNS